MKKILPIILFCLFFNVNTFADDDKSCSDGYSFYKTNASNNAFPIFKIESTSNKKIKIKKFKIKGNNNQTIYEKNISLIIDPYSIKTFEPFNFVSGIIKKEEIPLNPVQIIHFKLLYNLAYIKRFYPAKISKFNFSEDLAELLNNEEKIINLYKEIKLIGLN